MSDQRRSRSGRTEEIVDEDLLRMPRKSLVAKYKNALALVRSLEAEAEEVAICSKCNNSCKDRELADQFTQKLTIQEIFLRKNLAVKELEVQEKTAQLTALKNSIQSNSISSLQCLLQDPAANIVIQKLREDLSATKTKLEETQNELLAWKFTPDSNIGKQLMGRVRLLLAENKELGEEINSGRIAKLEGELALQKQFVEEVKNSQLEIDQFLQDLDEDTEGAQIVIYALESQLKNCRVCDEDTDDEETKSNNVSGIKRYSNGTIKDIPSVSKTETLTLSMESKSEKKSSKCKKSKDPKDMNDNKSNQLAEGEYQKKSRRKAHKKKHKSDRRKGEEKRPKVEKGTHSDNSLRAKNTEIDQCLQDLDEDTEGAQSVIYALESQLKNCRFCDEDTVEEETKSNNISGIKKYANGTIKDTPSVSKTETLTLSMESKSENKSSKFKKSKDPKDMNDNKSNQLAEGEYQKKSRRKAHKKKHKSDRRKGEEKHPKVENGTHIDNLLRAINSKPKSTDLITSFATVDG